MIRLEPISIHVGLEKPVRVLHITDVHISLADASDGEDMIAHAASRREVFFREARFPERDPQSYLEEAMALGAAFDATVITGDVIDFVSNANLRAAKRILAGRDFMFCAGNHEFCPKVGVPDSFDRRVELYPVITEVFGTDISFESRVIGGVNLISADNSYFIWSEEQIKRFDAELERGLPIVVFSHTPPDDACMLHSPSHRDLVPTEEVRERTLRFHERLIAHPLVKGFVAGHWHRFGGTSHTLACGKPYYVTEALFKGGAAALTLD